MPVAARRAPERGRTTGCLRTRATGGRRPSVRAACHGSVPRQACPHSEHGWSVAPKSSGHAFRRGVGLSCPACAGVRLMRLRGPSALCGDVAPLKRPCARQRVEKGRSPKIPLRRTSLTCSKYAKSRDTYNTPSMRHKGGDAEYDRPSAYGHVVQCRWFGEAGDHAHQVESGNISVGRDVFDWESAGVTLHGRRPICYALQHAYAFITKVGSMPPPRASRLPPPKTAPPAPASRLRIRRPAPSHPATHDMSLRGTRGHAAYASVSSSRAPRVDAMTTHPSRCGIQVSQRSRSDGDTTVGVASATSVGATPPAGCSWTWTRTHSHSPSP